MPKVVKSRASVVLVYAVLVLCGTAHRALAGEGFGRLSKKVTKLTRVHPPQVFISGANIAVRGRAQSSQHNPAAQRLQSKLESELLGNEPRFKLEASAPQTVVEVSILRNDYNDEWETRRCTRTVAAGKDSKGRQQYRTEEVSCRVQIVMHDFSSAFKVVDTRGNRSLLADTVNRNFRQEYMEGRDAPEASALEDGAVNMVVDTIVHRITRTKEIVGVMLPRGSMDDIAAFAEAGLWGKYLDALEKRGALAKPADEAYRQYALGVAYEALGYGADDVDTTLKYLEQASVHYNNAVDLNPGEDYFTKRYRSLFSNKDADPPLKRTQEALTQYQKLKEYGAIEVAAAGGGRATGSKGDLGAQSADALTNAAVIEMLRAGLSEDVIVTAIDTTPSHSFDVSPKGLIQLSEAKASKKLIQYIQSVATGNKPAKASSKPAPAKAKKN